MGIEASQPRKKIDYLHFKFLILLHNTYQMVLKRVSHQVHTATSTCTGPTYGALYPHSASSPSDGSDIESDASDIESDASDIESDGRRRWAWSVSDCGRCRRTRACARAQAVCPRVQSGWRWRQTFFAYAASASATVAVAWRSSVHVVDSSVFTCSCMVLPLQGAS